jgi:hypothetical protein
MSSTVIAQQFVVDESSYRIDKTVYPTCDEAIVVGLESARILGRRVNVYQLEEGVETFFGHAMPDGTFEKKEVNELAEPARNQEIQPVAPVAIGKAQNHLGGMTMAAGFGKLNQIIATLDVISEALESRGEFELALAVDEQADKLSAVDNELLDTADKEIKKIEKVPPTLSPTEDVANELKSRYHMTEKDRDKVKQAVRMGRG